MLSSSIFYNHEALLAAANDDVSIDEGAVTQPKSQQQ